jgi:mRNA-degrading endonuclease toxin of MazEF toxin-antitoxin module
MTYQRGDVILAKLPFTDGTGAKVRPGLVVQSDRNNARLDDVILALITSVTTRTGREATQLLVEASTPAGKQSGLLHDSAVKCEHLITLHKSLIQRVIGSLPDGEMRAVDACLKAALELP